MPDNDSPLPERLPHIELSEPREEIRRAPRGGPRVPDRDAQQHGERLARAAEHIAEEYARVRHARPAQLPDLPDGVQVLLKVESAFDPSMLKGLKLQFLEERDEGVLVVLSPDPGLQEFRERSSAYAQTAQGWTARTSGRRHTTPRYRTAIAPVDECQISDATARKGDKLAQVEIAPDQEYWVDIELAGGGKRTYKDVVKGLIVVTPDPVVPLLSPAGERLSTYEIDARPARVQRARVVRHRPLFREWRLDFEILITDEEALPVEVANAILVRAGQVKGIGDYRPRFGRFVVSKWEVDGA